MTGRGKRWSLLAGGWAAQVLLAFTLFTLFLGSCSDNEPALPTPHRLLDVATDAGYLKVTLICIGSLSILQGLFLLPMRLAIPRRHRGRSVKLSLAIAGLCLAALLVGFVASVSEMAVLYLPATTSTGHPSPSSPGSAPVGSSSASSSSDTPTARAAPTRTCSVTLHASSSRAPSSRPLRSSQSM
ncbi:MAG: hypothetical protein IPJ41_09975 [Phycisphaerales bacterium]|nr:hypothetical protein [Phycisphaerales bacterium]